MDSKCLSWGVAWSSAAPAATHKGKLEKKKAQVDSLAASSGVSNLKVSENNLHLTCYSEATGRECMHKQRVGCSQKENQTAIKMDETTESSAKS